ncbi:hypothetical protein [Micromonospora vulcania]|uniref:Secreted protein n=1 Tax=Micromonospora vulcania TaxID=1441873 RepID=A0ABW1H5F1_9ACTN
MRGARRGALAIAALVGVASTLLTPTAASAAYYGDETNYTAISSGPTGDYVCVDHTGVTVCLKPNGDELYVRDIRADGYAAVLEWNLQSGRWGSCVNNLGSGNWGLCNKDFPESDRIYFNGARYNSGNLVDRGWEQVWHT